MAIEILDPIEQEYRPLPDVQGMLCLALSASLGVRLSRTLHLRVSTASSEVRWKAPWLHFTAGTRDPESGWREFLVHFIPYVAGTPGRYLAEVELGDAALLVVLDLEGEPGQPVVEAPQEQEPEVPEGVPAPSSDQVGLPHEATIPIAGPAHLPVSMGVTRPPASEPAQSEASSSSSPPRATVVAPEGHPGISRPAPPPAMPRTASGEGRRHHRGPPLRPVDSPRFREESRPIPAGRSPVPSKTRTSRLGPWPWLSLTLLLVMSLLFTAVRSGPGEGEALQPETALRLGVPGPSAEGGAVNLTPPPQDLGDGSVKKGTTTTVSTSTAGHLALRVQPATVLVRVAGREERVEGGRFQRELPAGTHEVLVRAGGYRRQAATVAVSAGQTTERTVQLERLAGTLKVVGNPAGAEVLLNGTRAGKLGADGTLHVRELLPGSYEVKVRRPGWEALPSSRKVEVVDGNIVKASFQLVLVPEPGPLPVFIQPGPEPAPPQRPTPPIPEKF